MVLDDSVSAVDTKTEETILGNLKAVRNNKTTLIIAHRITTIKNADNIIIVDDGEIINTSFPKFVDLMNGIGSKIK